MGARCPPPSRSFGAALAPLPPTRQAESFQPRPDAVSGKALTPRGKIPAQFAGQITTDFKTRTSGERIKHRINNNSIKGYGKAHTPVGDLFRVETATNQIDDLRAYRPKEGGPPHDLKWRPLRYRLAVLPRRVQTNLAQIRPNQLLGPGLKSPSGATNAISA